MSGHPALSMRHVSDPSAAFFAQVNALRHRIFRPAIRRDVSGSEGAASPTASPRATRRQSRHHTCAESPARSLHGSHATSPHARHSVSTGGAAANAVGARDPSVYVRDNQHASPCAAPTEVAAESSSRSAAPRPPPGRVKRHRPGRSPFHKDFGCLTRPGPPAPPAARSARTRARR